MNTDTIIEVKELSKVYKKNFKKIHALKGISFSVSRNRILGILGPNGAGKTTLLKRLTGIIPAGKDSGTVRLLGTGDIETVKHLIGFLPENPEFFKNISAQELLTFSLRLTGTRFDPDRIDTLLKQVNLYDERNERVKHFSKGMRQRIGIAQAVIHSPELLILDEPMSGLDPPGRRMVIDIINGYYAEGKTILFSTHNLDDIEALCTDVMVLNRGEIMLEKSLSQLREKCTYHIEMENDSGKTSQWVENADSLWQKLREAKENGMRIIKIQSGIARQLEKYYTNE
ncbi:MAG: ABC transporter ATP-binding protein [bacterium]|nr:ABC transporter ATP-binding protein [bacterium]